MVNRHLSRLYRHLLHHPSLAPCMLTHFFSSTSQHLPRLSRHLPHTSQTPCRRAHLSSSDLWTNYEQAKGWLRCKKLPPDIDSFGVFCNDKIDMEEVEVYGFDYDYTLASYNKGVEYLIHDIAKEHLVKKYGYPEDIGRVVYDPGFPIRGLHYDVVKGLFLKVDSSHQIQLGPSRSTQDQP